MVLVSHAHVLVVIPGTWDRVVGSDGRRGWSNSSLASSTSWMLVHCVVLALNRRLCRHVALPKRLCLHMAMGHTTSSILSSSKDGTCRASVASLLGSCLYVAVGYSASSQVACGEVWIYHASVASLLGSCLYVAIGYPASS